MRSFFQTAYPDPVFPGSAAVVPADHVDAYTLAANAPVVCPIPAGATYVYFAPTAHFFARFGASDVNAILPTGNVTDGSAPELDPYVRRIPDGATHIALVAPAASTVTLSYWSA